MDQRANGDSRAIWLEVGLITLVAFLLRFRYAALDYPLFWDEFYHLLAARSWAADGTFAIAEGFYTRGAYVTVAIGVWFRVFGESLLSARMIPTLIGSLWVGAVFLWMRRADGRLAAAVTGVLFCFSPWIIQISGSVRFYGLQALLFWLGCIALFTAVVRGRLDLKTVIWGALGLTAWVFAVAILPMVLIGIVGLGLWAFIHVVRSASAKGQARMAVAAWALLGIGVAALFVATGLAAQWIGLFRWTPGWAVQTANELAYYEGRLIGPYPLLWTLLPIAGLIAIKRQREAGLMCVIVFATGLILHSFAAAKADRYFAYLMPFFFAIWGLALADLIPRLIRLVNDAAGAIVGAAAPVRLTRVLSISLVAAVLLFVLASNPAFLQLYRLVSSNQVAANSRIANWTAARDTLRSLIDQAPVVVTPNSVHALYYLGRYDFELRRTGVYETYTSSEFGIDPRTGRPNISELESLRLVMSCFPAGIFFTENWRWRNSIEGIDDRAADFLVANSKEIVLRPEWNLRVFRWDQYAPGSEPDCSRTLGSRG